MSKKIKVTVVLTVDSDVDPQSIVLREHDVIDGFELTRDDPDDDITDNFLLLDGYIESSEEL